MAQNEPKSLAQGLRKQWHQTNQISQIASPVRERDKITRNYRSTSLETNCSPNPFADLKLGL